MSDYPESRHTFRVELFVKLCSTFFGLRFGGFAFFETWKSPKIGLCHAVGKSSRSRSFNTGNVTLPSIDTHYSIQCQIFFKSVARWENLKLVSHHSDQISEHLYRVDWRYWTTPIYPRLGWQVEVEIEFACSICFHDKLYTFQNKVDILLKAVWTLSKSNWTSSKSKRGLPY